VAQCNNALIFPGIGLGILAVRAEKLTKGMLQAACHALAQAAPILKQADLPVLPALSEAAMLSLSIAEAVIKTAREEGLARVDDSVSDKQRLENVRWPAEYLPIKPV